MEKITVELNDSLVFNYVDDDVEITDVIPKDKPPEKPRLDTSFDENQNPKAKEAIKLSQKEPNLIGKSTEKVPKTGPQENGVRDFVTVEVNSFLEPVEVKTADCNILETKRAKSPVKFNDLDVNQSKKNTPLPLGIVEVDKIVKTNHSESPKANNTLKIGSVTIKPVCSDLSSIQELEALKSKRGRPKLLKSKEVTESYVTKELLNNIKTIKLQDTVISKEVNPTESKNESPKEPTVSKFDQLKAIMDSIPSAKNNEVMRSTKPNITKTAPNPQINEPKSANMNKATEFAQNTKIEPTRTDKIPEENTELQKTNKLNNDTVPQPEEQKSTQLLQPPKRKRGRPVGFSPKKKGVAVKPLKIKVVKYKRGTFVANSADMSKPSDLAQSTNLETAKTEKNPDLQPKEQGITESLEPPKRKRGRPKKKGIAVKPLKIKFVTYNNGKTIGLSSKKENFALKIKNSKNIKSKKNKNMESKVKYTKSTYTKNTGQVTMNIANKLEQLKIADSPPLKRKPGRPKKKNVKFAQLQETNKTDLVAKELQTQVEKIESEFSTVNETSLEVRLTNSQEKSKDFQPAKKKRGRPKGFSPKKLEMTITSTALGSPLIKKAKTNGFSPTKTQSTLITQFFKASSEKKVIDTLESRQFNDVHLDGKKSNESALNKVIETSEKVCRVDIHQSNDSKVLKAKKTVFKSPVTKAVTFSKIVQNLDAPKTQTSKIGVSKLKKSNFTTKSDILEATAPIKPKEVSTDGPIPASDVDVEVKILDEPEKNKGLELSKPKRGRPKGSLTKKVGTPDVLEIKNTKSKESEKTKKDLLEINNVKTKKLQLKNVEASTSSINRLVSSKPGDGSNQTKNASVEIIDVEMSEDKKEISDELGAKQLYVFVKSKDLDVAEKAVIEAELKRRSLEVTNLDRVKEIIDLEAPKRKRGRVKGHSAKKAKSNDQNQDAIKKNMVMKTPMPKRKRSKGFNPKKLGKSIPEDDLSVNLTVESEVKVKEQHAEVADLEVSKNVQSSTVPTVKDVFKPKRGRPRSINPINLDANKSCYDQKASIPIVIEDNKVEVKEQDHILEVIDLEAPKRKRGRPAKGTVTKRTVSLPANYETKMLTIDLVRADLDPSLDTKVFRKTEESDIFKVPLVPPPKQRNSLGKGTSASTSTKRNSLQFTTPKNIKIVSPFIPRRTDETVVQKNTDSSPKPKNIVSPRVVQAQSPTKNPLMCTVGTQTIDISDDDIDEPIEVKDSDGKMSVSCQADIGAQKGKESESKDSEAKVLVSSVKIFKLDGLMDKRGEERSVGPKNVEPGSSRDVTKVSISEEKEENSEEPIKIEDEIGGSATQPRENEGEQGVKYETVEQIHTEFKYESQSEAEQMLRRRRMGKFGGPMRGRRRGYNNIRFKGQTSIDNFVRIVDLDGKLQNMKCANQIFKCDHCLYVGNCKANLARHSLVHRPPDEIIWFQCTECPYRSKYEHQLKSHFLVHMDPNKIEFFQCPHCEVRCSRKHNLTNHIRSIHADRKYSFQCAECVYTTFSKDRLVAHLKKHSKEVHACNLCKFVTKRREYLLSHFKMKHTHDIARPFPCDTCSYKGKTKRELDRHYDRMHNKDQLHVYQCNHCSFNSIYKKNLEFHLLHMHQNSEGFQKFVCGHCDKTFSYKNGLKVHIVRCHLKLTDDDWHKCLECKYKSKDVATLKRHIKRNHGAPRLHCQQCSFATNRQMSMDAHVKTHDFDNEDILKCPECPYRIIQMTSFLYHMKVIHGKPIASREAEQYYMQED